MRTIPIRPYIPAAKRDDDEAPLLEPGPLKGRGTAWTIDHRYAKQSSEPEDDGWGNLDQRASEERVAPATQIIEEHVKNGRVVERLRM